MSQRPENLTIERLKNHVLIIQFNHPHYNNPFSQALLETVLHAIRKAEKNSDVKAVIVTGGLNRSFSVGGDFHEVKNFEGNEDVERWLDKIIDLYVGLLQLSKPLIAAIDGYAIGIGFQIALTCDVRIGTDQCKFSMPELKHGIACTLGQYMLEKELGRSKMMRIVYGCETISAEQCLEIGILNKITSRENLLHDAHTTAEKLSGYPTVAMSSTKKVINEGYIRGLLQIAEHTKAAHKAAFKAGHVQEVMKRIVGEKNE